MLLLHDVEKRIFNMAEQSSDSVPSPSSKFKNEWSRMYPVKDAKNDQYSFYCIPCMKNIKCDHQGITDVKNHCSTATHKRYEKQAKSQPSVSHLLKSEEPKDSVTRAEVIMTNFMVQHNLPLATSDHLGPLFRSAFPDSDIASSIHVDTQRLVPL